MAMLASPPCECCSKLGLGLGAAQASNEWGYINDTQIQIQNRGPSGWKGICQYGEKQSPVDLSLKKLAAGGKGKLSDLIFNYKDVERTFVTNMGHGTPQVNFSEGNETIINGETYSLLQFHFHTPSEHAFDGQRFAMEAHLVHKSKTSGNFAVVGVMLEPSALRSNVCLGLALDNVPKVGGTTDIIPTPYLPHAFQMDPAALLPRPNAEGHRPYIHYQGSLTTPPCSEGVMWYVMTDPVLVGDSQILRFMKFVGAGKTYASNARPLQEYGDRSPLQYNDRPVLVSEDFSGRI